MGLVSRNARLCSLSLRGLVSLCASPGSTVGLFSITETFAPSRCPYPYPPRSVAFVMLGLARRGRSLVVSLRDSPLPGHVCTCPFRTCPFLLQQSPFFRQSFRIVFSLLCSTTRYTYVRVLLRLSSSRVARSASRILDYRPLPTHCCCNVLRVLRYHVGRQRLLCKVTYTRDGASQVLRAVVLFSHRRRCQEPPPPYGSQYGLLYCG